MEIFTEFISFFDGIILLVAGTLGAIWVMISTVLSRFSLAILTGIGRTSGAVLGQRFGGQMQSRRMPSTAGPRRAREALWRAEARQQRMALYVQAWHDLLATRGGPFALSIALHAQMHDGLRDKIERLRERCREFDRLEEIAQHRVQKYEREYARMCEPIRDHVLDLELELARLKARHARQRFRFWRSRWQRVKRRIFQTRRAIFAERIRLMRSEFRLNEKYRVLMQPALSAVEQYERAYLTHWVHSFEADLESARLTVVTGRLIDLLFQPAHETVRARLMLDDLPEANGALYREIVRVLDARGIGYPPAARIEGLFEMYLRARLADEPAMREAWGVNEAWLRDCLPPPGALGIAHATYYHLPHGEREREGQRDVRSAA